MCVDRLLRTGATASDDAVTAGAGAQGPRKGMSRPLALQRRVCISYTYVTLFSCVHVVNMDNRNGWRGCPGPKKRDITAFGVEQSMCVLYIYAVGALLFVCVCYIWRARQKACRGLWRPKGVCVYDINMSYCAHVYMFLNSRRR